MDAIVSDLTGNQIPKDTSFRVDLFNRGAGTHIALDFAKSEWEDIFKKLEVAIRQGQKWYKLSKNDAGKWERVTVEAPN